MSGLPLAAVLSAGQSHESRFIGEVLDAISLPQQRGRSPKRPVRVVCDKGHRYRSIKDQLRKRGIRWMIPTRSNQRSRPSFDRSAYRRRNIIERLMGWLKEYRRIGTRHKKLTIVYHASLHVFANILIIICQTLPSTLSAFGARL